MPKVKRYVTKGVLKDLQASMGEMDISLSVLAAVPTMVKRKPPMNAVKAVERLRGALAMLLAWREKNDHQFHGMAEEAWEQAYRVYDETMGSDVER